jgi:steroid delta-isomerase-like uncharacterized protein
MRRVSVAVILLGLSLLVGFGGAGAANQAATPTTDSGATPAACPATTEDENIAIARVWHEDVINQRRPEALQDVIDPHVVHHAAGGYPDVMTAGDVGSMMSDFLTAFPDLHYTFDFFVTQDDMVVERYTATGTQEGALGDLPASGRLATWTGVNIFRIECGKIAEVWSEVDALSRNTQLSGEATPTP